MSSWFGWTLVVFGILVPRVPCLQATEPTDEQWSVTIDIAGRQRMLSQKMTKEFLLIALGAEDKYKSMVNATVGLFDTSLQDLINGNMDKNIVGAQTQDLPNLQNLFAIVQTAWTPFKATLLNNLGTIRDNNGEVNVDVVREVRTASVSLLKKSNAAVGELVNSANIGSAMVVNVAGRQRMLIQRMAKEAFLVALGLNLQEDVASLKSTLALFRESHNGIIFGAPWVDIPALTNVCTMRQMSLVSSGWQASESLMNPIITASSLQHTQTIALRDRQEITSRTDTLFPAMVAAVKLYVRDTSDCEVMSELSEEEWRTMIKNVGNQRFLGEVTTQLFMQIVLGVQIQNSKVELTVQTVVAQSNIRRIMEGSQAADSPTAPSQTILDKVLHAYEAWSDMKKALDKVITTGVWDDQSVERVSLMNQIHLHDMNLVADLYVESAMKYAPSLPGVQMNKIGHNRQLFQTISVEACLINYGYEIAYNWKQMNSSIEQ